ncbi:MAG: ABC transporter substrate-binding protein, partial [Chloroflexi bacterium]|nr:ABC transporter substrate-binding protein [Chloroflexota bacterium]
MKRWTLISLLLLVTMIISACGGAQPTAVPTAAPAKATEAPKAVEPTKAPVAAEPTKAAAPAATAAPAAAAVDPAAAAKANGLTELADAYAGKYKGAKVTMTGPFTDEDAVKFITMTGPFTDEDAVKFNNSMKDFSTKTGITIQYEGSKTFEASITVRVQAGDAPDIVDFPQPGLLGTFARQGKVIPATKLISPDWLKKNYLQSWLDMATMTGADGKADQYGVWQRFNGKSLVWYPKAAFDKAGYKIPQTWDELVKLTEQIAKDGDPAWCVGIESGAATGWAATDWTEDLMLRTTSLENYDKWVKGELKFSSPEVKKAIETFATIWNNDKYVYGGKAKIVTTFFGDAPAPMFQKPPKCWL